MKQKFYFTTFDKGQSLVEVLVASAIFILGITAIAFLVLDAAVATRQGGERAKALLLAREGLEAARSLRDADFDNLVNGAHGIALSGGAWTFSGSFDTQDQFTRQVTVEDVVVGAIDGTDIKKVTSRVTWQATAARQGSVVLVDYLTDWNQTQGDAEFLDIDISDAGLGGGGRRLENIEIWNGGSADITIDKITVWWDNDNLIERIRIDGDEVWKHDGAGSPDGRQPSGTELDIENYEVEEGAAAKEIDFQFSGTMGDAIFVILFTLSDGSTKYVVVEPGAVLMCDNQASFLTIDTSGASIGGGGKRELRGVEIQNTEPSCAIAIDTVTVFWNNSQKIEDITIEGTTVWAHKGPGAPSGKQNSGTELDIIDFRLEGGSGPQSIDRFKFDGNMTGVTFDIHMKMKDGTVTSTGNFSP